MWNALFSLVDAGWCVYDLTGTDNPVVHLGHFASTAPTEGPGRWDGPQGRSPTQRSVTLSPKFRPQCAPRTSSTLAIRYPESLALARRPNYIGE